jgi:uncharacterized cupredoxin-like copper-binding protein
MRHLRFAAVLLPSALLLLASCTATSPSPTAGGGTTIDVTRKEWSVVPAETTAPAGDVTFSVTNEGPDDIHEFVIMKTDLDPAELPTVEDGSVDEEGEGVELIGEIEEIPIGETMEVTKALDAGNYVLLCNIYTAEENEAHYQMGMRIGFTVE